ncbi:BEL1-like homeodomain protein 9 [Sesamum angolense]|uniref:BEL1-like homeodomain protein 9 n=1 Tax=Sesamum angolense TaxID=2727404 RepID=A0AAE1WN43_9LAMI|nr:BEL1-like homeodomain protein 9 [Sesamum angolense]
MAEGLESYHVPQQSRRDKLRVNNHSPACLDNLQSCCAPLLSAYDPPALISSDFNLHRQSFSLPPNSTNAAGVKEEGMNLMGFVGGNHHMYVDPQLGPLQLNPTSIQDISGTPCVYAAPPPHCYRGLLLDQSFHGNEVVVYKPDQPLSIPHQHPDANSNTAATTGQSLSLSLSSHHSNNLPLELNLHRYDSSMFSNNKVSGGLLVSCNGGSTSIQLSKSSVPLGPFTGYASVLKGSRFLKPAQQLLEELCDVGRGIGIYAEKIGADSSLLDPPPVESLSGNVIADDSLNFSADGGQQTRKKSRLLSMLDEVYKRYKQYYQQMQAAVAAFESVAGLSSAAPFANLALKAMSRHFRCLKNAITDQLQFTTKSHGKINCEREETHRLETCGNSTYGERTFQSTGLIDQPVWRPQRGLPERAVTVLRAWLFEHFLHPYPTDTDKLMLAKQTGLSRNQVSNWFINARVRLWKPMVEEIHMLETRQSQKPSQREEQPPNRLNDHMPRSCSIECENASTSIQRIGEKRNREDPTETATRGNEGPMKFSYDNLLHNPRLGFGVCHPGGNGGVSLTLGLHQNGMGLSEPYPINAARRFGLESHGDGYVVSGFAAQNREFGRDINMDGQLMHDFVG